MSVPHGPVPIGLADAALDLVLGGACVGCARPGRPLCGPCRAALPAAAYPTAPVPCPPGLAPTYVTGPYDGVLRALVLDHKERRRFAFTDPLGWLLAHAVSAAAAGRAGPLVLVPVPSRRAVVRRRGFDPTAAMTRRAAAHVTREAIVAPLLRQRPGVADQSELTLAARRANLEHAIAADPRALARLRRRVARARVVVCDDIVTTGATAREAQRALEAIGIAVDGIAAVAATVRRRATVNSYP